MSSQTPAPKEVTRAFAKALSAAELDRAMSLFAGNGCFVTPDATVVHGFCGIREVLAQLTAGEVQLQVTPKSVQMTGGMAICSELWTFTYSSKENGLFTRASDSTVVLCRSGDVWQLLIVAPWHIVNADQCSVMAMPRADIGSSDVAMK